MAGERRNACGARFALVSPITRLLTAVFFIAYQQFENYVLVPRVMKTPSILRSRP